uniref:Uncharacterized protein n=1 Tax=Anguilla anguilla TaxID=7936 RepID=A0A0E9P557_ANGAN
MKTERSQRTENLVRDRRWTLLRGAGRRPGYICWVELPFQVLFSSSLSS